MERKPERRVLARGLSQLMSETNLAAAASGPLSADQTVPIELIHPNPLQPRKNFDPDDLQELAESLRRQGVLQPLIVRRSATKGQYEIVAGERRWRAAQMINLHQLPVLVRDFSDQEVLEVAIIENIQRANLNSIEEARGYHQLMEVHGHTQDMVASALSKSRSHIANLLRLLNLPEQVQDMVRAGTLTAGHARALITSADPTQLAHAVVAKGMSVRETENLVRSGRVNGQSAPKGRRLRGEKDADTRELEADLSANLGMSVQIAHEPGGETGIISVRYANLEQLDALCQALSVVRRDILAH
jgi:ParB family transcriptional regulator, chromosome partitioning protein